MPPFLQYFCRRTLKDPQITTPPTYLNRKERKERKASPFVRETQKIYCDVFACLAVLAVQVRVQSVECATSREGH